MSNPFIEANAPFADNDEDGYKGFHNVTLAIREAIDNKHNVAEIARLYFFNAESVLGPNLGADDARGKMGAFRDLLADNTPWTLTQIRQIAEVAMYGESR